MNLQPYVTAYLYWCAACGYSASFINEWTRRRYCEGQCIPDGQGDYSNVRATTDPPAPHIHVSCPSCGCTVLMELYKQAESLARRS